MLARLCAAALLAAAAAQAFARDPALLGQDLGIEPEKEIVEARIFEDVVVAPIPISNPTIGTGLAVVAMPFYKLGPDSPLSNTAVAFGATSSGTWGVGAAQSTRLRGDDMRIDGFLGYVELHYSFYGSGAAAGSSGVSVPIVQKATALVPEVLWRVIQGGFVGVRYRGALVDTEFDTSAVPPQLQAALNGQFNVVSSGVGPVLAYDTRDHDMSPSSGVLIDFRGNYAAHELGSDFDYRTFSFGASTFHRAGPGVLALRGFACGASDSTPLFDLCLYGTSRNLRGYEAGRYRDRAMFTLQAEYRFPLSGRFGGVVFGGGGKVARSFNEMGNEPGLPSVGAGVRWLASEKARVNLSVDVAWGRDSSGIYVYVKESF